MTGLLTNIVAAGASVIFRPAVWPSEHNRESGWMGIAIEYKGLRHGIACHDLEEGLKQAHDWLHAVMYYDGIEWTAGDVKPVEARSA